MKNNLFCNLLFTLFLTINSNIHPEISEFDLQFLETRNQSDNQNAESNQQPQKQQVAKKECKKCENEFFSRTDKAVLAAFAKITGCFYNIISNPDNKENVGQNVAEIAGHIFDAVNNGLSRGYQNEDAETKLKPEEMTEIVIRCQEIMDAMIESLEKAQSRANN